MNFKQAIISVIALLLLVSLLIQNPSPSSVEKSEITLEKFSTEGEFNSFVENLKENQEEYYERGFGRIETLDAAVSQGAAGSNEVILKNTVSFDSSAEEYSTTNIQIEGVSEPDFIKNDGKYIYALSGGDLYIVDAYPAFEMKVISTIDLEGSIGNIFLSEDTLVVFENGGYYGYGGIEPVLLEEDTVAEPFDEELSLKKIIAPEDFSTRTRTNYVKIYDITNRENPELVREVGYDGNYIDARMIGDYVYLVSSKYLNFDFVSPPVYSLEGISRKTELTDIYYPRLKDSNYQFTSIAAIEINGEEFTSETYLLGASHTLFMSEENLYLTQVQQINHEDVQSLLLETVYKEVLLEKDFAKIEKIIANESLRSYEKDFQIQKVIAEYLKEIPIEDTGAIAEDMELVLEEFSRLASKLEKTAIYKISVDEEDITYIGTGLVPGTILNQYSMDEHKGNLRVATTTGNVWSPFNRWSVANSFNHLYILDEDLEVIGSVEDLAEGERIYSARFVGDTAYMVTYRTVDPLFIIDVEDPKDPEVLGYLKISGYSSYLHPYDEEHLIGIGMETTVLENNRVANSGVKITLFDVSDFESPEEVSTVVIGDSGSSTPALYDFKAVLFDREKNLLVIPITVYEKSGEERIGIWGGYQDFKHTGAYVFDIDTKGIREQGVIVHGEEKDTGDKRFYNYYQDQVKRSLYLDDFLYTISEYFIKANDLSDLEEVSEIKVREKEEYGGEIYY